MPKTEEELLARNRISRAASAAPAPIGTAPKAIQPQTPKNSRDFGISAAVIGAVTAVTSTAASAAGASKQAKEQKDELAKGRKFTAEESEKNRKLQRRETNLVGLQQLAGEREKAGQVARSRSTFATDLLKAAKRLPTRQGRSQGVI